MSEVPFYKVVAGRLVFEKQIPEAIAELKKLRIAAERIAAALEAQAAAPRPEQEEGR